MDEKRESFEYSYSADEQKELRRIREKYAPKEDKMAQLRRLDESATRPGTIAALAVGIVGAMLLGVGMACTMVWMGKWFVPGIIIGCVGVAGIAAAYPVYSRVTKRRREKIAPEIMRLTDELMK